MFRTLVQQTLDKLKDEVQWEKDEKEKQRVKKQLVELAADWGKDKRPQTIEDALKEIRGWKLKDGFARVIPTNEEIYKEGYRAFLGEGPFVGQLPKTKKRKRKGKK